MGSFLAASAGGGQKAGVPSLVHGVRGGTVDDTNPASPNTYYTTRTPGDLAYFGIESHAGVLPSAADLIVDGASRNPHMIRGYVYRI